MVKLPYGAIKAIADTVGVNYNTVRYWLRFGKPRVTRIPQEKAIALEKLIASYTRQSS